MFSAKGTGINLRGQIGGIQRMLENDPVKTGEENKGDSKGVLMYLEVVSF